MKHQVSMLVGYSGKTLVPVNVNNSGQLSVTTGAGSTVTQSDNADVGVLAGAVDTTIPNNNSRKSISIGAISTNTGSLRLQATSDASASAKGIELQPGTFVNIQSTQAFALYNPTGATQVYWWVEYS